MKQILKYTILCLFLYFTPTFAFSFCNEQIHAITEDLNWNLDENGVLTVTGKGEMNFNVFLGLRKKTISVKLKSERELLPYKMMLSIIVSISKKLIYLIL